MNFKFNNPRKVEKSLSRKEIEKLTQWKNERADGKWFWVFKRASAWLVSLILMFGAANFFAAEAIKFDISQIFIAICMFGGFFAGSIMEWAKMEKMYQTTSLTTD